MEQRISPSVELAMQAEPNDLVWLVDDNVKRGQYKMARVLETYAGNDGIVRSASIRTQDGAYKRRAVKLAPLFHKNCFVDRNRAVDVGACHADAGAAADV